ncbi:hypothetical protein B0H16DRAFT_1715269 [Mycena metata]|uniref:Uncharacterized protein n=1 Tax=Mycena metata TaxID=1033252 RepID=A0AAD7JU40_9AGAR|nr:hypothetical protein B0H16DRAFT_1715269 [Mycena metata]
MTVPLGGTGLSYASSAFLALFLEALFYGLFAFMFAISLFVLHRKRPTVHTSFANGNLPLLSVSTLMFILGTIHLGIDAYRAMQAFVYFPGGAFAYLLSTGTNQPIYIVKNVSYYAQMLLGDGFMIYRLYKVWGSNKLITFPFLVCLFANVATGVAVVVTQTLRKPTQSIFSGPLHLWPLFTYILTLMVNVGCTTLIAYRIWAVNRQTKLLNVGTLVPVAVVIVESGVIYAVCVVLQLGLFLSDSGGFKILEDVLMQITGLVFCGIIASIGLGLSATSSKDGPGNRSSVPSALVFGTSSSRVYSRPEGDPDSTLELQAIEKGNV